MGLNLKEAKALYLKAKKAYYNGKPIMTDAKFDKLEDWITSKDSSWEELKKTGVKVGKKHEVKLPYYMPSLNKCYPQHIDSFFDKYIKLKWLYMAKLDGCSVLLEYVRGNPIKLITRGNGEYGKDISYFIPYLNLPRNIAYKDRITFRCEAILRKEVFSKKWMSKFDNARNMVSGLLNRQTTHSALKDIHFVVLGVYGQELLVGLKNAFKLGFETVWYKEGNPRIQASILENVKKGKYEADGVVIADPKFVYIYSSAEKPRKNIIAYKENSLFREAKVLDIVYQISSSGRIIPKIKIEPTQFENVSVEYCTCHNAQWMLDREIGPGAIVSVTRSGDVIPKIENVIKKGRIKYPSVPYIMQGVHFVAKKISPEQSIKKITKFVNTLGIENVKENTIKTLYKNGVRTIHDLLILVNNPLLGKDLVSLFGPKQGLIIAKELKKIIEYQYPIEYIMIASNLFDTIGIKRLHVLQEHDFDLLALSEWEEDKIKESIIVPSIGEAIAEVIARGLVSFNKFWKKNKDLMQIPLSYVKEEKKTGSLTGLRFAFTGYRDKEQEEIILNNGGEIAVFNPNKTDILLYKKDGKASSKLAKAKKAMTFEVFSKKYL